jgi:hypothetical protein
MLLAGGGMGMEGPGHRSLEMAKVASDDDSILAASLV